MSVSFLIKKHFISVLASLLLNVFMALYLLSVIVFSPQNKEKTLCFLSHCSKSGNKLPLLMSDSLMSLKVLIYFH